MGARFPAFVAMLILLVGFAACGPTDPHEKILEERALWQVNLLDWVVLDDGTLSLGTRVSGPPSSSLRQLTVRLVLQDASGNAIGHEWHTLDISGIQRGGPEDITLRVPTSLTGVEGIGIDPVLAPTPEEISHISELAP
jgi:hypothetical protein